MVLITNEENMKKDDEGYIVKGKTRYYYAERPQVPWRVQIASEKKAKSKESMFSSLGKKGKGPGMDDDDMEERFATRTKFWVSRRAFPVCTFCLGALLLFFFMLNLPDILERHTGDCFISGFAAGTDCRDCKFEVHVTSSDGTGASEMTDTVNRYKPSTVAQINISHTVSDGVAVANFEAFECCAPAPIAAEVPISCCDYEVNTKDKIFCDRESQQGSDCMDNRDTWSCTFKYQSVSDNQMKPYDVEYGSHIGYWVLLISSLVLLLMCFPFALLSNHYAQLRFDHSMEENITNILQKQKEAQEAHEAWIRERDLREKQASSFKRKGGGDASHGNTIGGSGSESSPNNSPKAGMGKSMGFDE